ncbi:MAG: anthrone oxygenase family protein [Micrococcaceae bacterium]
MTWLEIVTLLIVGFVGSAEFASVTLVHPVIRKLNPDAQLVFEQGLLKTFGRVMPAGMTAASVLAIILAVENPSGWLIAAALTLGVALGVTIAGNVPINLRTGRIRRTTAPEGFIAMRRRWDLFQLIRGSLQLAGFILVTLGILTG